MKYFLTLAMLALFSLTGQVASAKKQGQELLDSLQAQLPVALEDTNKINLLNDLSYACGRIDPDRGIQYGLKSAALAQKLRWNKGESWAMNAIGNNYSTKSEYPKALDYFFKALRLNEERADTPAISIVLANISSIYYVQGDYDKTLEFCQRALHLVRLSGDKAIQLNILGNIGIAYHSKKEYAKAADNLIEAIRLAESLKDKEGIVKNLGNLANTYTALGDYRRALDYNFRALKIARELGLRATTAIDLGNIGETYLLMASDTATANAARSGSRSENLKNAVSYLEQGISACRTIGFLAPMAEFNEKLADAQRLSGNYKAALEAYEAYRTYSDSVYSATTKIQIANLETQRAVELKNKQIEIDRLAVLKKRNERGFFIGGLGLLSVIIVIIFRNYRVQRGLNNKLQIAKRKVEVRTEELDIANQELSTTLVNLRETQAQLIDTEKQKENETIRRRISQDIHDDISSELTRISWVSELAKTKAAKSDFTTIPGLLEKITESSRETVAKLGEIIWAVTPQNDSLASLVSFMRSHINRFFADTHFICTLDLPEGGDDVHLNPELKRNLFLVMKESLNNTVKYSGANHVKVALRIQDSAYRLCISDDGKGIEDGVIQGGGNGLGNMRRRMEAVQGFCSISSRPGQGTEICCSGNLY